MSPKRPPQRRLVRPPKLADPPDPLETLDRIPFLEAQLTEALADVVRMREGRSYQALVSCRRQVLAIRAELDEAAAARDAHDPNEDLTDAQLLDAIEATLSRLAPVHLDRLARAIDVLL